MGRKEDRLRKKLHGESLKKKTSAELPDTPFMMDGTKIFPIRADNVKGPVMPDRADSYTPDDFQRISHEMSDTELNRVLYLQAKDAVENGYMRPRPDDDYGTVMRFTWEFITDEMREL